MTPRPTKARPKKRPERHNPRVENAPREVGFDEKETEPRKPDLPENTMAALDDIKAADPAEEASDAASRAVDAGKEALRSVDEAGGNGPSKGETPQGRANDPQRARGQPEIRDTEEPPGPGEEVLEKVQQQVASILNGIFGGN